MVDYIVVSLGDILSTGVDRDKVEEAFKKFSCQQEVDLENFLVNKAILYENSQYGKTFLLLDKKQLEHGIFQIIAYYTIALKSLDITQLSKKRRRKVLGGQPGRDQMHSMSAYLIGQIGRNDIYTHDEMDGETILNECYHSISIAARIVGGQLIVLECREHMYETFYQKQSYLKLYDELSEDGLFTLYKRIDFQEYWNRFSVQVEGKGSR